jgi:hypothetical protein
MKKVLFVSVLSIAILGSLVAQSSSEVANPLITDGLVAFYPFNGDGNDASGIGNDLNGSDLAFETDRFNNEECSLMLAGDSIDTGIGDKGTICFWIKLNAAGNMGIFSAGEPSIPNGCFDLATFDKGGFMHKNEYNKSELYIDKCGLLLFLNGEWKWQGETTIAAEVSNIFDNKWHFFAIGWNGKSRVSISVDGRPVNGVVGTWPGTDASVVKSPFIVSDDLRCGAAALLLGGIRDADHGFAKPFKPMNGAMDDLRVYSRQLKDSELQTLYREGKAK